MDRLARLDGPRVRRGSRFFAAVMLTALVAVIAGAGLVMHARPALAEAQPDDPVDYIDDPHAGQTINSASDLLRTMIDSAKPVEEHAVLDALVGEWKVESRFLPAPGYPAIVSKGTAKVGKIIGGRFVESSIKLGYESVESENRTTFGYDTRHKKYTLHAIDSFGTYAVDATGPYDKEKKSITFAGEVFEPSPDEKLPGNTYPFEMVFELGEKSRVTQTIRLQMPDRSWFEMTKVVFTKE